MKTVKSLLSVLALTAGFGLGTAQAWAKDNGLSSPLSSVKLGESNYCHMRFPAIDERTLYSNRPLLKDRGTGDIIDFYGRCDYDPHGKEAVQAQRLDHQRRLARELGSE